MQTAAKITRLIMLLVVVFTLVPGTNPGYGQEKLQVDETKYIKKYKAANRYFMRGKSFFLEGKYGDAEKQLKKGLKTMAGYAHPECHFYLARLYYKKGDFQEALSQIKKAKADFESSADLLQKYRQRKAVDLKKQKQDLDATYLEVSNNISSDRACGSRWLGDIAEKAYEVEGKLNRISRAADASASSTRIPAEYYYFHGNILFKLGQYSAAYKQYRQTVALEPGHGNAYNNLANLHYMNKEYRTALQYMNKAEKNGAKINPKFRQAVVEALGQLPTGVERFQVIVGTPPDEFQENTYVVYDKETRDALIIDPGARDPRIERFIQTHGLKVKKILNTHGHHDHIGANRYYANLYQVKIAAHQADEIFYTGKNQENKPDEFFSQEGTIRCGSLEVKILHTPGHSPGSVCFYIAGHLFSGDTLFKQAVGRTWGQTEAEKKEKMARQISHIKSKLLSLPANTPVFPGHGPSTTIGEEALRF